MLLTAWGGENNANPSGDLAGLIAAT